VAAEFATIPPEVSFQQVVEAVHEFAEKERPLLEAVIRANEAQTAATSIASPEAVVRIEPPAPKISDRAGPAAEPSKAVARQPRPPALPIKIAPGKPWSPAQRNAITRLINLDSQRRVWMGSLEITELVRRQLEQEASSMSAADLVAKPGENRVPSLNLSSPGAPAAAGRGKGREFWFKVNAELVIYGATEPTARVTVAERPVKLRPDGTFTFRFSLPDGVYQLPARAVERDGKESLEAWLEFSRSTQYSGKVGEHEQDATLQAPRPENIR
jgi:hypothetical protein